MNTLVVNIFTDQNSEFLSLTSTPPGVDLSDISEAPLCPPNIICPTNFVVTPPVAATSFTDVEFLLSNNFWGCVFNFGDAACGVNIRQGIAHLVDKTVFSQTALAGQVTALDNPVPPSNGLATPVACGRDPLFPETDVSTGGRCVVGASPTPWTGGVAYNLAPGSPSGLCGYESSPSRCAYPWMRGFGSSDFCAGADHLIAAGLATGKDANCVLTGVDTASVTSHPVMFFVRTDSPARNQLGLGMAETICALFTGSFTNGCTTTSGATGSCMNVGFPAGAILCITGGTITTFPGLTTCKATGSATTCTPLNNWWMYTGAFSNMSPFDSSLYFLYNSRFVSAPGPPCAATTTTVGASNYMYVCDPNYDTWSSAMEFALCASAAGDPVPGSSSNSVAGTCPGATGTCPTTPTACSAVSAGFMAEQIFGDVPPFVDLADDCRVRLSGQLEERD